MTTTTSRPDTATDWLPTYCPSWCDGEHAQALEDGGTLEEARQHSDGGPGDCLREIRHAGRIGREYDASYDLAGEQRPNGPSGAM